MSTFFPLFQRLRGRRKWRKRTGKRSDRSLTSPRTTLGKRNLPKTPPPTHLPPPMIRLPPPMIRRPPPTIRMPPPMSRRHPPTIRRHPPTIQLSLLIRRPPPRPPPMILRWFEKSRMKLQQWLLELALVLPPLRYGKPSIRRRISWTNNTTRRRRGGDFIT